MFVIQIQSFHFLFPVSVGCDTVVIYSLMYINIAAQEQAITTKARDAGVYHRDYKDAPETLQCIVAELKMHTWTH